MSTNKKEYCCKLLEETWEIYRIGEEDIKHPTFIQESKIQMGYDPRPLKLYEVYIWNEEFGEIVGEPFKFCPWCGAQL
jgi:hypothetical protein